MRLKSFAFLSIILCAMTAPYAAYADQAGDTLARIRQIALQGENPDPSLVKSVVDEIEKNAIQISKQLRLRIKDGDLTDKQLAIYIWAMGLTKDQSLEIPIVELFNKNKSDLVKASCLKALAMIGGKPSEDFLLSTLDATKDNDKRFNILDLLSQMQCEAALSRTEEILDQDPAQSYWQSVLIFGKMGDKAVPFLVGKINDRKRNIRANAINLLGQWLIPPEAAKPLQEQLWVEKDEEIRGLILTSLENTITDFTQVKSLFEKIASQEKNEKMAAFARETVNNVDKVKSAVKSFSEKKKISSANFQMEYEQLYDSAGTEGDYEALAASSALKDEPKLKKLREVILQRNSDEALEDYQKVNEIIIGNRLAKQ